MLGICTLKPLQKISPIWYLWRKPFDAKDIMSVVIQDNLLANVLTVICEKVFRNATKYES